MQPDIAHHAALDERLVKAVRGIKLLSLASWPADAQSRFLAGVARGQPALPAIEYPRLDFGDARRELAAIAAAADPDHPLGCYLRDSVRSWDIAAQLLEICERARPGFTLRDVVTRVIDERPDMIHAFALAWNDLIHTRRIRMRHCGRPCTYEVAQDDASSGSGSGLVGMQHP